MSSSVTVEDAVIYALMNSTVQLGTELDGIFNPALLIASVGVSIVGAWAGVNVMEAFRTEKRKRVKQVLLLMFGFLVGGVSIWSMHFVGMNAFSLTFTDGSTGIVWELPVHYDVLITAVSFFSAALLVYAGAYVASTDVFFGASNEEAVSALQSMIELKKLVKVGKRIKFLALFKRPQRLIAGGVIAGFGVCVMHFAGMTAVIQHGFEIQWNPIMVGVSCIIAATVASVGFWIVFRLLQWRPNSEPIRFGSAVVIAFAVCSMHYTGMTAATYVTTALVETEIGGTSGEVLLSIGLVLSIFIVVLGFSGLIIHMRKSLMLYRDEITEDVLEMIDTQLKKSHNYEELQRNLNKNIIQVLKVRTSKSVKSTHAGGGGRSTTTVSESVTKKSKNNKNTSRVVPSQTPDTGTPSK